jgi:hypothetical protein
LQDEPVAKQYFQSLPNRTSIILVNGLKVLKQNPQKQNALPWP